MPSSGVIELLNTLGKLKTTKRTGWIRAGVPAPESISDHMHRAAMMAFMMDLDASVDRNRLALMCLVHDVAESKGISIFMLLALNVFCKVGDITPSDPVSREDKATMEENALIVIRGLIPGNAGSGLDTVLELWREFEHGSSVEAVIARQIDKLEMLQQAAEYERAYSLDLSQFFDSTRSVFVHPQLIEWEKNIEASRPPRGKQ